MQSLYRQRSQEVTQLQASLEADHREGLEIEEIRDRIEDLAVELDVLKMNIVEQSRCPSRGKTSESDGRPRYPPEDWQEEVRSMDGDVCRELVIVLSELLLRTTSAN